MAGAASWGTASEPGACAHPLAACHSLPRELRSRVGPGGPGLNHPFAEQPATLRPLRPRGAGNRMRSCPQPDPGVHRQAAAREIMATATGSILTKQRYVLLENLLRRVTTAEHPQTRTGYVKQLSEILIVRQSTNQAVLKF